MGTVTAARRRAPASDRSTPTERRSTANRSPRAEPSTSRSTRAEPPTDRRTRAAPSTDRSTRADRPTRADLLAAEGRTIPDVLRPRLAVLFCGINPGLWSAATGYHFARPGNRFWPALHRSGFTPRQLHPSEQAELPGYGLGITNIVARGSARADELTADELRAGALTLTDTVSAARPRWLAILGVTAYRTAFDRRRAVIGRQPERIGGAHVWILPNPSGLNAHYTLDALAREFAALRAAAGRPGTPAR
jgi:TDG/mug DNA glycosylase family protein